VFAYLKSQGGPFRLEAAIAVLRQLPIQSLVYVPRASKSILDMQTRTLRVCTEPVDVKAVLARCDLAILNGTAGTATQCLLAGVPLVMVPQFLEQVVFSRGVVQLGAGVINEPNRIELLAGRIWRLLQDDRYRKAARAFANRYAKYDPAQVQRHIIDRVESLLMGSCDNRPFSKTGVGDDPARNQLTFDT
jgi:UDP:flavonoid glycosyltransferase YjiC (YdhE family)